MITDDELIEIAAELHDHFLSACDLGEGWQMAFDRLIEALKLVRDRSASPGPPNAIT